MIHEMGPRGVERQVPPGKEPVFAVAHHVDSGGIVRWGLLVHSGGRIGLAGPAAETVTVDYA